MNVVVDFRISHASENTLKSMGYNVIKTPKLSSVYNSICGHADIMLHKLSDHNIVAETTVCGYFSDVLKKYTVVSGNSILTDKYPYDIAYNVARVGNFVFCNEKYTDKIIMKYYNEHNIKIINTNQGYAKCSTCVVSDNAIITSDKNIANKAYDNNIDVLFTDDKKIRLKDFDHGFIGGASGLIAENILAVNGNIEYHSNCNQIIDYCKKYNVDVVSLNDCFIEDIGSILLF
ncbi:MAG: hypothetical protein PUE13_06330 [Clostridiales bacterium]|nr:hypothetical protein [Clostridiales bacterium]